jgi:hypothetical protein
MNMTQYASWRETRAWDLPAGALAIIDAAYRQHTVTKGMRRVTKPFGGVLHTMDLPAAAPAKNWETKRDALARQVESVVEQAFRKPAVPRCQHCKAPTICVDENYRPCCEVAHGVVTRSIAPPGVTVATYAIHKQVESVVEQAFRKAVGAGCHFCGEQASTTAGHVGACRRWMPSAR